MTGDFYPLRTSYIEAQPNVLDFGDAAELLSESLFFHWKGVQANLATFNTLEEYNFLLNNVVPATGLYWVGASDAKTRGLWSWVTGRDAGQALPAAISALLPADNPNGYACLAISSTGLSYQDCNSHAVNILAEWRCQPGFALGIAECEG